MRGIVAIVHRSTGPQARLTYRLLAGASLPPVALCRVRKSSMGSCSFSSGAADPSESGPAAASNCYFGRSRGSNDFSASIEHRQVDELVSGEIDIRDVTFGFEEREVPLQSLKVDRSIEVEHS
jgi:hypothetical protein